MVASFPGSSAPERDIEIVHAESACKFRVPESRGVLLLTELGLSEGSDWTAEPFNSLLEHQY